MNTLKTIVFSICLITIGVMACMTTRQNISPCDMLTLSDMFSDHMVLQRDQDIIIWGNATPGAKVKIIFRDQVATADVKPDSTWKITLKAEPAGGPDSLIVICGTVERVFQDVLVGEVWLCSGQSNMEMPLVSNWATVNNFEQEVQQANYPSIRLFKVERSPSVIPVTTIDTRCWQPCSPQTIADFSAVAYFFGRDLHQHVDVPVGLIQSAWGGTIVEAWTSGKSLKKLENFADIIKAMEISPADVEVLWEQFVKQHAEWEVYCEKLDPGIENGDSIAIQPEYDDSEWLVMNLPTTWENTEVGELDGAVWFRKTVNIPQSWLGSDLTLRIGPCDDHDNTWFNGLHIGKTDDWDEPRIYTVPQSRVRAGKNVITVRVVDDQGAGGIWGEPANYGIDHPNGESIDLSGAWRYLVAYDKYKCPPEPKSPEDPNRPAVLYNGMIHPLVPYNIRGAIWYQGESNTGRAYQYRELFNIFIKDWREIWGKPFPFYFVQLANYMERNDKPVEDAWAELREAQTMALELPNTGMAVAIDIGDADDIHPGNKQEVGRRLALWARNKIYGESIPYSGPLFDKAETVTKSIRIYFKHLYNGLNTSDGELPKGFAIAGEDRQFVWADVHIEGQTVVVSSPQVPKPVAVRYGWSGNPDVNLINSAGLPASPFRTDSWPGLTVGIKQ